MSQVFHINLIIALKNKNKMNKIFFLWPTLSGHPQGESRYDYLYTREYNLLFDERLISSSQL